MLKKLVVFLFALLVIFQLTKTQSAYLNWSIILPDCQSKQVDMQWVSVVAYRERASNIYSWKWTKTIEQPWIVNVGQTIEWPLLEMSKLKSGTYFMTIEYSFKDLTNNQIYITQICRTDTHEGCSPGPMCGETVYEPFKFHIKPMAPTGPIIIY